MYESEVEGLAEREREDGKVMRGKDKARRTEWFDRTRCEYILNYPPLLLFLFTCRVEMYTFSRNKLNSNPSLWSRLSLLTIFFISSCAAYLCALLFSMIMQASNDYNMLAEAISRIIYIYIFILVKLSFILQISSSPFSHQQQ